MAISLISMLHASNRFSLLQDLHLRNLILKEEAKEDLNLPEVLKEDRNKSIDWMVEMQAKSGLKDATIFLAINTLDDYLCSNSDPNLKHDWELLRVACLSISSKLEEIDFPRQLWEPNSAESILYGDESSTLRTEIKVLLALGWHIKWITPWDFVQACVKKLDRGGCPEETLREKCVSIMKGINTVSYRPSVVACATVITALRLDRNKLQFNSDPFLLLKVTKEEVDKIFTLKEEASRRRRRCRMGTPHRAPLF